MKQQQSQPIIRYRRRIVKKRKPRRSGTMLIFLLLCLVALFALVGNKGWNVYQRAQDFRYHAQQLAAFRPSADREASLNTLSVQLHNTHTSALALRREAHPFLPIAKNLGWLPAYGADIAAVEPLLDTVLHLTNGLEETVVGITPMMMAHTNTEPLSLTIVATHLSTSRPHLQQARQSIIAANDALEQVDVENLSPRIRDQVEPLVPMLPLLDMSLHLALVGSETSNAIAPVFTAWQQTHMFDNTLILFLHRARPEIVQLRETLAEIAGRLDKLPQEQLPDSLRSQVQQATYLLPIADATLDMVLSAEEVATVLTPLFDEQQQRESLGVALNQHLQTARPALEQMHQRMGYLYTTLEATPMEDLSPALQQPLQEMQQAVQRGGWLVTLTMAAPDLLGAQGSREYLLIALNPDELRAAGGLMSATGVATINQGYLDDIWMEDSSHIDRERLSQGPYIAPPEPLRRYMGLPQWALWDAGWSPDFRYSASAARYLYNLGHDPGVTDVIAFTPQALQYFLEATGPLNVEGTDSPVTSDNLLDYMRTQYDEIGLSSESFLEPLLEAIFARVVNDVDRPDPFLLSEMLRRALNERHLQVLVADESTAKLFTQLGWDGAVRRGSGDFLMVVDSNMSYSKSHASIQQSITYTADLQNLVTPKAQLDIHYAHTSTNPMECWHYKPGRSWTDYERSYIGQMNRCYWDYLRVLLAPGSIAQKTTRHPTPAEWLITSEADTGMTTVSRGENGTTMLSTFFVVPSGGKRSISYGYGLPNQVLTQNAQGWRYHLRVQKQAGRENVPLVVQVLLPDGAAVVATSHPPSRQEQHLLVFELPLETDRELDVVFR